MPTNGPPRAPDQPVHAPATQEESPGTPRNAQESDRSYLRADLDLELLAADRLRPVRLFLEYDKVQDALDQQCIRSTVVLFGGTRIIEPEAARTQLARASEWAAREPANRAVQRAQRIVDKSRYYTVAREFGRLMGHFSVGKRDHEYVIMTGGGPGIMEAGNRGAFEVGAKGIGLNIHVPHEQHPNPYITPGLCFQFRYFALRKMHFLARARALIAFPGGYGTLDEIFDALCLIQTKKMPRVPVVLVGREFWQQAMNVEYLCDEGVIDREDADLITFADTAEEIRDIVIHATVAQHRRGRAIQL